MKKFSRVYIEISNVCNLQCDFCPEVHRKKKVMSFDLFQKVIDQVSPLTEEVTFHLMGEPLAHPLFSEFLGYCEKVGVPVNLTTNGTLLSHKDRAEALLSPIVRQVNFSLQSWFSNFPDRDAHPYLKPIFDFTRKAFLSRPDLYINYRFWNMGSPSGESLNSRILRLIGQEFGFVLRDDVDVASRKSYCVQGRLYLHFDSRFDWPSLKGPVLQKNGYCHGLKTHFAIHADGTVVPCCLDKEADIALGRVSNEREDGRSVLQALHSDRACHLREGFERFELRDELCRRCGFISRFKWRGEGAKNPSISSP